MLEITPANAVEIAKDYVLRFPSDFKVAQLVQALVARVEELEYLRPRKSLDGGKTWVAMSYEEIALNEREVAQLAWKQQRDAAVDILRAAQQSSDLATRKNGYVADALAALGAEETK